jgi:hypothetical protein
MRASPLLLAVLAVGCGTSFRDDVTFLGVRTETIVLAEGNARVAVCPEYQGRVMTSAASGDGGRSFGWINYELIGSGERRKHINAYGGEDRFWLGPEGGQFSIFFSKGAAFDLAHWQTPAPIDAEPFDVVRREPQKVQLRKVMRLTNYSGTVFDLQVDREVRLLRPNIAWQHLQMPAGFEIRAVAYESVNRILNTGVAPWTKESGLLSVWILGMFVPSEQTTVVVPFGPGPGQAVNDLYFGKVPADRLRVVAKPVDQPPDRSPGVAFFKADGLHRSKIGVPPGRARPILGSWDAHHQVLTLVQYTLPGTTDYVNSLWERQKEPYAGDAVNSYNDGPASPGAASLGSFYELESSSPAAALLPGRSLTHVHRTFHFEGPRLELDKIARRHLGVSLDEIEEVFGTGSTVR